MNARVPTLDVHDHELVRHIAKFRAFLEQGNLDRTRAQINRLSGTNPFRRLLLNEKQPWLQAVAEVDRRTLRGARPLKSKHLPQHVWTMVWLGRALEELGSSLLPAIRAQMRSKLLDLHGKAWSVVMEWDSALFFLRRGYRTQWTEEGQPGPEYRCEGNGVAFEVECKRISRLVMEELGDREALNLGYGVLSALSALGWEGSFELRTPHTTSPDETEVVRRTTAAFPADAVTAFDLDVDIAGIGRLWGRALPFPPHPQHGLQERLEDHQRRVPHDHRGFAATVPFGGPPRGAASLWLQGPRRSHENLCNHIEERLIEAARQFRGDVPGFIMFEAEGVRDAALFRDNAAFRDAAQRIFAAHPVVAAILWRGDIYAEERANGFVFTRAVYAERNPACAFPNAGGIPVMDA